ncbi:4-vinyl reductase [Candidatus Bathyarchaeota archaeon]|nr:4-vinyl reductase [Candidatus Bathyarchaeota archaeon]
MKAREGSFTFQFETFGQMENALELIFSPSAASVILYTTAIKCGVHLYQKTKKEFNKKEEALNYLSSLKKEENWGKMSFQEVDFKNGSGRVIIDDSFEAMARKTNQPSCHFFRGFIAGFLSELLKKTIVVTEEKCAGKGDEHCEFIFREQ